MEQRVLAIEARDKVGKGISRRLRSSGLVPAVVYGKGIEPVAVSIDKKELAAAIAGEGGINHLITLKGGGDLDGKIVIVADLTRDALKGQPIHVDLHKINLEEKVRVKVPVSLKGSAIGVKEGGLLDFHMHVLEIECLPAQIPEHIDVDITNLKIGGALHVSDVQIPAGFKVLDEQTATIVNILGKAVEAEAAAQEAE
ncbi:MAG: 50S ribosomal protein L25 [Deltaproteobacteria bacterium]|nr:50S ribosomal protein L25 [Deltaproteobacteria bacterium]